MKRVNFEENHPIILYRGVKIPTRQIKNYSSSIGKLISTKSFFSTSRDRRVAERRATSTSDHSTKSSR